MKKFYIIRNALLGGCMGMAISNVSIFLVTILLEGANKEIVEEFLVQIGLFFNFAFWFAIASYLFYKNEEKSKKMSTEEREKFLKHSRLIIVLVELISIILAVLALIFNAPLAIIVLLVLVCVSILIWLLGSHLAYTNLKSNIEKIKNN